MVSLGELNEFDFGILGIVLFQIGKELLIITGMDSRRNPISPFRE